MESTQLSIPITNTQVIELARRLSQEDKQKLLCVLQQDVEADTVQTHWASESVLGKEWLNETENQAWQHL